MCAWESTLALELTPKPLFSSSSPCRPSSLFLFLFCCRSNSSWIFFVQPERYLPPFSCVVFVPHQASSVQQPSLYYLPSLCSSSALPIVTCAHVSPYGHQPRLQVGARMGRTCTKHWDWLLLAPPHHPFSAVSTRSWGRETWFLAEAQVLPSFSAKTLRTCLSKAILLDALPLLSLFGEFCGSWTACFQGTCLLEGGSPASGSPDCVLLHSRLRLLPTGSARCWL